MTAAASSTASASAVPLDEHVAIIGQGGSGKNELALLLARLIQPTSGRITIGGVDLAHLAGRGDRPADRLCRRDALSVCRHLARQSAALALRHAPMRPAEYEGAEARRRARQLSEARRSGNIDFDIHADWVDYEAPASQIARRCRAASPRCSPGSTSRSDVYSLGLRWRLDPEAEPGDGRAAARSAQGAGAATGRGRDHQPRRDLRSGTVQHQRLGRGEPAVWNADRSRLRVRGARRQHLCAAGARPRSA